jgi:hypothetical protein
VPSACARVTQLAAFAAAYVRFAADETALFDIGFCTDIDKSRHPELAAAGQALFDALMPVTRQLTASEDDAFDLLLRVAAGAHGLAVLHRQNMFGATEDALVRAEARAARTARDIIAGLPDRPAS